MTPEKFFNIVGMTGRKLKVRTEGNDSSSDRITGYALKYYIDDINGDILGVGDSLELALEDALYNLIVTKR